MWLGYEAKANDCGVVESLWLGSFVFSYRSGLNASSVPRPKRNGTFFAALH